MAGSGCDRLGRLGEARPVRAKRGRHVGARIGETWHGRLGMARAGEARLGRLG